MVARRKANRIRAAAGAASRYAGRVFHRAGSSASVGDLGGSCDERPACASRARDLAQLEGSEWIVSVHGGRYGRRRSELGGGRSSRDRERGSWLATFVFAFGRKRHHHGAHARRLRSGAVVVLTRSKKSSLQFELRGYRQASHLDC